MKLNINEALLKSYGRHALGAILASIIGVSTLTNTNPIDFSAGDWASVLNALWVAVVPVLVRYFDKKDPAYGKVMATLAEEVSKKLEVKKKSRPRKKA